MAAPKNMPVPIIEAIARLSMVPKPNALLSSVIISNFHTFNVRVDYRKQFGRLALVSFLDVVNLYGHLNVNEDRFLEITGEEDSRGFTILPTAGLKIEF